jgi:epoxyqueuosine reductase
VGDEGAELKERLFARARALGFARAGVAVAERLEPEGERLAAWVAAGRHGTMEWMASTVEIRRDPRHEKMLSSARSVVVLVAPYARAEEEPVGPLPGRVARYARGRDYHNVLDKRSDKLAKWLRREGHSARATVDVRPMYERAWAQRAGVGFVGKNCCLIVPGLGSHVFLATLVTSAVMPADESMAERCGACRLCLDACPTAAFEGPRELDARRCISYLTIEHDGAIDEALRPKMGDWVFGCDVCQDVCPFNRTAPVEGSATAPFAPSARLATTAEELLAMDEAAFAAWAHGSPFKRAGRASMARNAAIALGNTGERRHLPVLERAASDDPSDAVRDAAAWAARRIWGRSS